MEFTQCRGSLTSLRSQGFCVKPTDIIHLWSDTFGFVSLAHPDLHRETNPGILASSHSERICVIDFRIRLSRALFGRGCL
jgi:hypothetical protein